MLVGHTWRVHLQELVVHDATSYLQTRQLCPYRVNGLPAMVSDNGISERNPSLASGLLTSLPVKLGELNFHSTFAVAVWHKSVHEFEHGYACSGSRGGCDALLRMGVLAADPKHARSSRLLAKTSRIHMLSLLDFSNLQTISSPFSYPIVEVNRCHV